MVIYGIVTETNIGKLFAAGVIPGLLTAALLMVAVVIMTSRDPEHAPAGEKFSWAERWKALRGIWGVLLLVIVVLGGIYGGFFTATEGAGIGASGAFLFAVARRALTVRSTLDVLIESARTTAMLFTLLIAATIFANFVNFTSMPGDLKEWITHLGLSPVMIVGAMMVIYVILGTVMEELTMVLLTIPLFFPIVVALGFDPGLVRRADRDGDPDRPDLATRGHEPVCHQHLAAQGRPGQHLSRRLALRGGSDHHAGQSCWRFPP